MEEKYYGNYLGYVVANNSPLKDATVQVFVPVVNARIFQGWVSDDQNKHFRMAGTNIASLLTPQMETYLQETLPWARISQPILGSGSAGYKNQQISTVSDGNFEQQRRNARPEQSFSNKNDSEAVRDGSKLEAGTGADVGEVPFSTSPEGSDPSKFTPKYETSALNESGVYRTADDPAAVGAVSSGKGDFGGKSYGTYQFASQNSDDLKNFVNWENNPYREELGAYAIGSQGFDNKWKEIALRDNRRFGQAQEFFQETQAWGKDLGEFQRISGVNLNERGPELTDLVTGSVNQYRSLTAGQARHIAANGGNNLTDKQIGMLLQDYKLANVDQNFKSSSADVRRSVANRIREERRVFEKMSGDGTNDLTNQDTTVAKGEAKASSEEALVDPAASAVYPTNQPDHLGAKAGVAFENSTDEFSEVGPKSNNRNANPTTQMYNHTNYSNMVKGSISLPQPGAYVWVFFEGGNPNVPVVFGYHYGQQDVKDIYDANSESPDYPPATTNEFHTGTQQDDESTIFRNKTVFNERGGSMDIVSTTGRERIKITHFKGSHLEFNQFGGNHYVNGQNQTLINGNQFETIKGHDNWHVGSDRDTIILGNNYLKVGDIKKWTPIVQEMKDILEPIHDKKRLFELQRAEMLDGLDQSSQQKQSGTFVDCPVCQKEHNRVVDNEYTSTLPDECPSCGSTGVSPSSQDGEWEEDPAKAELEADIQGATPKLANLEKELAADNFSDGGSDITFVANDKVQTIGLVFNDMPAHRKDEAGKFIPYALNLDEQGVFPDYKASPLVESVHVDPLPGGDYTITAGNRLTLISGSNGMQLKTLGRLDLFGSIANIAAEQLNLSSRSETTIDGGKRLDMTGDVMSFRPRIVDRDGVKSQSVVFDGNLNVSKNMIVAGSMHVDGELTVSHITAPVEEQYADIIGGDQIGVVQVGSVSYPVISIPAPNSVKIFNIPLYLPDGNTAVRKIAQDKVTQLFPAPSDMVSPTIRRVADTPALQFDGVDEPFINEHGDGAEEALDSGAKFEEAL